MVKFNKDGALDFAAIVIMSFCIAAAVSWLPLIMANVIVDTFNMDTTVSWQKATFVMWVIIGTWWTVASTQPNQ